MGKLERSLTGSRSPPALLVGVFQSRSAAQSHLKSSEKNQHPALKCEIISEMRLQHLNPSQS